MFASYGRSDLGDRFEWKMDCKNEAIHYRKIIALKSPIFVQRAFRKEFRVRNPRGRKTILNWVTKFRSLGTVESLNTSVSDVQPPLNGLKSGVRSLLTPPRTRSKTAQNGSATPF